MDSNEVSKFKQLFIEEATTLLNSLEGIILDLENNPNNLDLIQEIFRVMHTIKGVSGMYGFEGMSVLTHNVENIYDLIRNGIIAVDKDILDLTLAASDHLFTLMNDQKVEKKENKDRQENLLAQCNAILSKGQGAGYINRLKLQKKESSVVTYNIIFHTHQSILDRRINVLYAIKDLAEVGEIRSIYKLPVEGEEEERWSIFVVGEFSFDELEEALMFVYEYCVIRKVANLDVFNEEEMERYQQELIAEEMAHLEKSNQSDFVDESDGKLSVSIVKQSINTDSTIQSIKKNMNRVSVDSEKLDYLMYLVSELITTSSQLNLISTKKEYEGIRSQVEKLDKLSKNFRNNALDIRLIPIRDMVPKFNRLIRDVSKNLGKEVEFITEGMETELDKSSIDMVAEPLVHLLRNALDHGIESPETRVDNGKEAKGVIKLSAYNSGNNIYIEVIDDGKGLDKDKLVKTAIAKGLLTGNENLSEKEIFNLICHPGFSTAKEITSISGRGVGMDVVKQKISDLRGEFQIKSELGKGTTFTIKLQQSIAILDTLLVRSDDMKCLLPLSDVEVCSQMPYEEVAHRLRHGTIDFEQELVPFVSLRDLFSLQNDRPTMAKVVIVTKNGGRAAIITDEIIGQHQAVLKPMGELVKKHEEISAASVLGNGEVAFLIDTNAFKYTG